MIAKCTYSLCLGSGLHIGFGHRLNDDGIRSVILFTLLKSVAGSNGQRLASAVERKRRDGIIVLPRLL